MCWQWRLVGKGKQLQLPGSGSRSHPSPPSSDLTFPFATGRRPLQARWRLHKLCILQPWEVLCNLSTPAEEAGTHICTARVLCCTFAQGAQHAARRARRPAGEILPRLSSAATRCSRSRYFLDRPCNGHFSNQHQLIDRNQQCSADVTKYLPNYLISSSLKSTPWQLESKKRLPHDAQIESRLRIRRGGLILNWG